MEFRCRAIVPSMIEYHFKIYQHLSSYYDSAKPTLHQRAVITWSFDIISPLFLLVLLQANLAWHVTAFLMAPAESRPQTAHAGLDKWQPCLKALWRIDNGNCNRCICSKPCHMHMSGKKWMMSNFAQLFNSTVTNIANLGTPAVGDWKHVSFHLCSYVYKIRKQQIDMRSLYSYVCSIILVFRLSI